MPRPHRFDAPSPVAVETERVAQRMRSNTETTPAFVDLRTGTVYGEWRSKGASASLTLLPPGERHAWILQRYRAFVRPNGWGSSVFVDLEQVECDAEGFSWSATEIRGDCRPITQMTETQLRTLDQIGASLRG